MKRMKKDTSEGVAFARKEPYEYDGVQYDADITHGDIVVIKDEGIEEAGQFGTQFNLRIETRNGVKKVSVNARSENAMIEAFGEESTEWIDKKVKIFTKKDVINNKRVIIAYLLPSGYIVDEWGDVVKKEADVPRDEAVAPVEKTAGQKQVEEAQALDAGDIPF